MNLKTPVRVFLRGGHEEDDPITLGIILVAADKEKVSANLEAIAKKANLREEKAKGLKIYLAAGKNIGIAIKGQVLALIGIAPMGNKTIDPSTQIAQRIHRSIRISKLSTIFLRLLLPSAKSGLSFIVTVMHSVGQYLMHTMHPVQAGSSTPSSHSKTGNPM